MDRDGLILPVTFDDFNLYGLHLILWIGTGSFYPVTLDRHSLHLILWIGTGMTGKSDFFFLKKFFLKDKKVNFTCHPVPIHKM